MKRKYQKPKPPTRQDWKNDAEILINYNLLRNHYKTNTMDTQTKQDKEVLNISPTPWFIRKNGYEVIMPKDGVYSVAVANTSFRPKEINEANAKAICTSVNETYGKGYRPEAMEELYKALEDLKKRSEQCRHILQDGPSKGYWGILDTEQAETALQNAKL